MNNQNGLQNGLLQPLFAPVNQANKFTDDIDLSDIFAEYLNDGTADPLTTFSTFGSIQHSAPVAQAPVVATTTGQMMLPTGGIRTAFHNGAVPNIDQVVNHQQQFAQQQVAQQQVAQQQVVQQQVVQQQQHQQLQYVQEPELKKAKIEPTHQLQQYAAVPQNLSTTTSGITGRLGYNMTGGQLTLPLTQPAPPPPTMVKSAQGNVQLPIGVGIRVGGITPQATNGAGGLSLSHVQYGVNSGDQVPMWAGNTTGGLSDQAMAERRQRNREHAKRSRVRKKFLLESLQAEVRELQSENENLRMVVQSEIPEHAQKIISECCSKNPLFDDDESSTEKKGEDTKVELVNSDFSLIHSLTSAQQNFVLSDPRLPDNPIVYASDGFYQLTGYTREQVLGRNCRFLQGPGTDPKAVDVIRTAVANGTDATTCLLNYKADGTPFWNQFFVAALRDSDNCIVNYVGVQCAVDPEAGASALEDKVNSVLPLANKDGVAEKKS